MALVSLSDLKTFLGVTGSSQDDLLNLLNDQASAMVESYTGRTFAQTDYTEEEYDGTGNRELKLNYFPIVTFTKLEVNNAADNTDNWSEINSTDYWVDTDTGIITRTSSYADWDYMTEEGLETNINFNVGKNKYRATYTAGYASVPEDIQYVVMALISEMKNAGKFQGLKSETLGDHTVTFQGELFQNPTLKGVLDQYRDIPLAK